MRVRATRAMACSRTIESMPPETARKWWLQPEGRAHVARVPFPFGGASRAVRSRGPGVARDAVVGSQRAAAAPLALVADRGNGALRLSLPRRVPCVDARAGRTHGGRPDEGRRDRRFSS